MIILKQNILIIQTSQRVILSQAECILEILATKIDANSLLPLILLLACFFHYPHTPKKLSTWLWIFYGFMQASFISQCFLFNVSFCRYCFVYFCKNWTWKHFYQFYSHRFPKKMQLLLLGHLLLLKLTVFFLIYIHIYYLPWWSVISDLYLFTSHLFPFLPNFKTQQYSH